MHILCGLAENMKKKSGFNIAGANGSENQVSLLHCMKKARYGISQFSLGALPSSGQV